MYEIRQHFFIIYVTHFISKMEAFLGWRFVIWLWKCWLEHIKMRLATITLLLIWRSNTYPFGWYDFYVWILSVWHNKCDVYNFTHAANIFVFENNAQPPPPFVIHWYRHRLGSILTHCFYCTVVFTVRRRVYIGIISPFRTPVVVLAGCIVIIMIMAVSLHFRAGPGQTFKLKLVGWLTTSVQHRKEIGGDICLTTLKTKETFVL